MTYHTTKKGVALCLLPFSVNVCVVFLAVNTKIAGGESEIRTHGGSHHDGFQDRSDKPLWHLSVSNSIRFSS